MRSLHFPANGNPAIQIYGAFDEDNLWALGIPEFGNVVKVGVTDAEVTFGSTGTVSIHRNGSDTSENIESVHLDHAHGDENISASKEVEITWFADEGLWRFTGADCE